MNISIRERTRDQGSPGGSKTGHTGTGEPWKPIPAFRDHEKPKVRLESLLRRDRQKGVTWSKIKDVILRE